MPDPFDEASEPADAKPDPLELAYRYLNRRDRTEREVRKHLAGKGVEDGAAQDAIQTLREQGYVDDARYARLFAEDKRALEGWGNERISGTLALRGIDRYLIDAAVAADGGAGAEMERALEILRRRFPSPPRERRERDRALAVLLRKGYDADLALDALTVHARAS
ncbi:MAG TPA: regulatory protein RecX [Solirubrobacteraceae bacterium]|nr:regulatory protein RecX [Solirubrobacteraceae bacterium]